MALNPKLANVGANAAADAVARLVDNGYLRIYDSTGTGQPATADTAITTQVLVAELRFNATSAPAASAGRNRRDWSGYPPRLSRRPI